MTIGILKSPNPRNRNSISVVKSKFLSVSPMNTSQSKPKIPFHGLFLLRNQTETPARHFESHWRETWRHTGRRTVPQISLETPPPPSLVTFEMWHLENNSCKKRNRLTNWILISVDSKSEYDDGLADINCNVSRKTFEEILKTAMGTKIELLKALKFWNPDVS